MSAPIPTLGTPELRALTSARGIAAWLVVFYHIRASLELPPVVATLFGKGYLAVDFFFLLSGFVIALSWRERVRDGGWRAVPGFLQRRIARVWPLHAFVLTGGVMLALTLWATGRHVPVDFPFAKLPLHYLLIQTWGWGHPLAWNDPAWSISVELAAYLLFPLAVMAIDWRRLPSIAIVALIGGALTGLWLLYRWNGSELLGTHIETLGLPRCLIEFTCGNGLYELWRRWRSKPVAPIASLIAIGTMALWLGGVLVETFAAPLTFAALLMTLALTSGRERNPLEWRPLHRLGDWSYATYLAHFLMWKAFKLVFVHVPGPVAWWLVMLYLALVLAASALLYERVELPAQKWINALGKGRTRTPVPARP